MRTRTTVGTTAAVVAGMVGAAWAQPSGLPLCARVIVPDAVTGDNAFSAGGLRWWNVDAGADRYQVDLYERPVTQTFVPVAGRYAAEEYHAYVDIAEGRFAYDGRYMYFSIRVAGLDKQTKDGNNDREGLAARYGVRFSADPDGRGGVFLLADQPKDVGGGGFTNLKTEGWRDDDRDVGGRGGPIHGRSGPSGLGVTKSDNPQEEAGLNGFERQYVRSDGYLAGSGAVAVWQRISPADATTVELAFDYVAAGFTRRDVRAIRSIEFLAILGGTADPQNALWNDKYTRSESGSPNPGAGGLSEFGTQGLGNIYLADNVRVILPACRADVNGDGELTFEDIQLFVGRYNARDVRADYNDDCEWTFEDIQLFVAEFNAGC